MTEGRQDAAWFIDALTRPGQCRTNLLGTIASSYTSGRPRVLFDGESVLGAKVYPVLGSYSPAANDRVLLVPVGTSYVIVGKIV